MKREVLQGRLVLGATDAWRYTIETSTVSGTAQGTPTLTVYDVTNGASTDVTATVVSGACILNGTVITTGVIRNMTVGHEYKCVVVWFVGSSEYRSCYFIISVEL